MNTAIYKITEACCQQTD